MNLLDLMRARRKNGKVPTMQKMRRSKEERIREASGLCTGCGVNPHPPTSVICPECEGKMSMEEIQHDIQKIRNHILNKGHGMK